MSVDATNARAESYVERVIGDTGIAPVYAGGRARMRALVEGLDDGRANAVVPACPRWRVRDVLAHVTGICADVLAGNLDGVATDAWTDRQVSARRDRPLAEVVAEWDETGPQVEALIPSVPLDATRQLVADLVTHEHDVRGALSAPGARDSDAVAVGIAFVAPNFLTAAAARGIPALRLRAEGEVWTTEGADPEATLSADRFELLRALTGRRSRAQVRALKWEGDPERYLDALTWGPFTVAAVDVFE
jgi:uncharacterized protein (TIGR03083 family)